MNCRPVRRRRKRTRRLDGPSRRSVPSRPTLPPNRGSRSRRLISRPIRTGIHPKRASTSPRSSTTPTREPPSLRTHRDSARSSDLAATRRPVSPSTRLGTSPSRTSSSGPTSWSRSTRSASSFPEARPTPSSTRMISSSPQRPITRLGRGYFWASWAMSPSPTPWPAGAAARKLSKPYTSPDPGLPARAYRQLCRS